MPEFILDTSGKVGAVALPGQSKRFNGIPILWESLDPFTQGYIEALFFTSNSPAFDRDDIASDRAAWDKALQEGQSDGCLPTDAGFGDLEPDALASIIADCEAFQRDNAADLAESYLTSFPARVIGDGSLPDSHREAWDYDAAAAGRDYWYTRNGHGVGYWDRGLGEVGDRLSDAARYSEVDVYWTEEGKVSL